VPFGGGQGGIVCNLRKLSEVPFEKITRRYMAELLDVLGLEKDVPAPDVNTDEQVIAMGNGQLLSLRQAPGARGRHRRASHPRRGGRKPSEGASRPAPWRAKSPPRTPQGSKPGPSSRAPTALPPPRPIPSWRRRTSSWCRIFWPTPGGDGLLLRWVQKRASYNWPKEELDARLERVMAGAFDSVLEASRVYGTIMRLAAYCLGIRRVADVLELRGIR
jgi:hypothetical protein